ncbi:hypothetical protein ACOSP7_019637 [Xanthoceras sorbifolium]
MANCIYLLIAGSKLKWYNPHQEEKDSLPFLLLHLGCPDNITAYCLEYNELRLRHFLGRRCIQSGSNRGRTRVRCALHKGRYWLLSIWNKSPLYQLHLLCLCFSPLLYHHPYAFLLANRQHGNLFAACWCCFLEIYAFIIFFCLGLGKALVSHFQSCSAQSYLKNYG